MSITNILSGIGREASSRQVDRRSFLRGSGITLAALAAASTSGCKAVIECMSPGEEPERSYQTTGIFSYTMSTPAADQANGKFTHQYNLSGTSSGAASFVQIRVNDKGGNRTIGAPSEGNGFNLTMPLTIPLRGDARIIYSAGGITQEHICEAPPTTEQEGTYRGEATFLIPKMWTCRGRLAKIVVEDENGKREHKFRYTCHPRIVSVDASLRGDATASFYMGGLRYDTKAFTPPQK